MKRIWRFAFSGKYFLTLIWIGNTIRSKIQSSCSKSSKSREGWICKVPVSTWLSLFVEWGERKASYDSWPLNKSWAKVSCSVKESGDWKGFRWNDPNCKRLHCRDESLCARCCHCRDTRGTRGLFAKWDTEKKDLVRVSVSSYLGSRRPLSLPPDKHWRGCKPRDSMIKGRCTRMDLNLASDEMLVNSTCRIDRFLLSRENFSTDLDLYSNFWFQIMVYL